jgi:hypothetical protein
MAAHVKQSLVVEDWKLHMISILCLLIAVRLNFNPPLSVPALLNDRKQFFCEIYHVIMVVDVNDISSSSVAHSNLDIFAEVACRSASLLQAIVEFAFMLQNMTPPHA